MVFLLRRVHGLPWPLAEYSIYLRRWSRPKNMHTGTSGLERSHGEATEMWLESDSTPCTVALKLCTFIHDHVLFYVAGLCRTLSAEFHSRKQVIIIQLRSRLSAVSRRSIIRVAVTCCHNSMKPGCVGVYHVLFTVLASTDSMQVLDGVPSDSSTTSWWLRVLLGITPSTAWCSWSRSAYRLQPSLYSALDSSTTSVVGSGVAEIRPGTLHASSDRSWLPAPMNGLHRPARLEHHLIAGGVLCGSHVHVASCHKQTHCDLLDACLSPGRQDSNITSRPLRGPLQKPGICGRIYSEKTLSTLSLGLRSKEHGRLGRV